MNTRRLVSLALPGCAIALMLGGCIVAPAPRPYYVAPAPVYVAPAPVEYVQVAPPPPQYEVIGAPPVVGYVWLGGYWNWVGGRHVWVAGHWDAPRAGHVWVAHTWVREGGGWRMAPGHWERR
jgi:YXWGXW repeat-containing protein